MHSARHSCRYGSNLLIDVFIRTLSKCCYLLIPSPQTALGLYLNSRKISINQKQHQNQNIFYRENKFTTQSGSVLLPSFQILNQRCQGSGSHTLNIAYFAILYACSSGLGLDASVCEMSFTLLTIIASRPASAWICPRQTLAEQHPK